MSKWTVETRSNWHHSMDFRAKHFFSPPSEPLEPFKGIKTLLDIWNGMIPLKMTMILWWEFYMTMRYTIVFCWMVQYQEIKWIHICKKMEFLLKFLFIFTKILSNIGFIEFSVLAFNKYCSIQINFPEYGKFNEKDTSFQYSRKKI